MARRFVNLQTDLLRTFVTVVDLGNYTEAGQLLGRTQPAISLQIKRLEELASVKLIRHRGKQLELTTEGQSLIGYAREILRMNDRVVSNLHQAKFDGTLRVGLPTDYSIDFFQEIIASFANENTGVKLEIKCNSSEKLLSNLHADKLDMTIAITDTMPAPYVTAYWSERPSWTASRELAIDPTKPVLLVAHPDGCPYRKRMLQTLTAEGREWRIAFESPGITALQKAVLAGLGVSALTRKTLLPGMRTLNQGEGFPSLASIHIGLFYKHANLSDAALKLVELITDGVSSYRQPTLVHS